MFVKVDPSELEIGVKYAILTRADYFTYFTCIFNGYKNGRRSFHYTKPHSYIENVDTYTAIRNVQDMDTDITFYVFVPQKEKIQQAMEKRALDKILKRVVNEDFIWYGQAESAVPED